MTNYQGPRAGEQGYLETAKAIAEMVDAEAKSNAMFANSTVDNPSGLPADWPRGGKPTGVAPVRLCPVCGEVRSVIDAVGGGPHYDNCLLRRDQSAMNP